MLFPYELLAEILILVHILMRNCKWLQSKQEATEEIVDQKLFY